MNFISDKINKESKNFYDYLYYTFDKNTNDIYINHKKVFGELNLFGYDKLEELECKYCEITGLKNIPLSVKKIDCTNNEIASLDVLPENLEILICVKNKITSLDNLPPNLKILACSNNMINNLDNLPNSLENLFCDSNNITSLDYLPNNLLILSCNFNNIKNLDNLPNNLIGLSCDNNNITNLDNLQPVACSKCNQGCSCCPNNLITLSCKNNNITSLDNIPISIENLACFGNNIKEFVFFTNKQKYLPKLKFISCSRFNNCEKIEKEFDKIIFTFTDKV